MRRLVSLLVLVAVEAAAAECLADRGPIDPNEPPTSDAIPRESEATTTGSEANAGEETPPDEKPAVDDEQTDPNRLEVAGFPVLSYNSDWGTGVGVLGAITRFDPDYEPHLWRLEGILLANIRPAPGGGVEAARQKYYLELDLPRFPAPSLRLTSRVEMTWMKVAGYYGLGNASPEWADDPQRVHEYEQLAPLVRIALRHYLDDDSSLFGEIQQGYSRVSVYPNSALATDAPQLEGIEQHDHDVLRLGVLFDDRNHEIVPTRGMFHELSVRGGGSVAEQFLYEGVNLTARFYVPLVAPYLVFAHRAMADLLFGDPPFYELTFLGGADTIRGLPIGRFAGKVRLLGNFELRSRFLRFAVLGKLPMHLGAVAFSDVGRVFADYAHDPVLDGDGPGLKTAYGGGLRLQWGESFILRADVAWSPQYSQGPRIYIGTDHAF